MKIMKRIVSACLALGIASMGVPMTPDSMGILPLQPLSASAAEAASGTCGENLTWVLDDEGTLTISGEGEMMDYDMLDPAPWYKSVENITNIVIENGVTSIGDRAFYECSGLTTITIPDSVTSIGTFAFKYTPWLEARQKENSLVVVNEILIDGTTCEGAVAIPDSVTSIGSFAFDYCSSLTSITIPDSVTSIGSYAFRECSALTAITIPDSVTSIGSYAFSYCSALTAITIPDSVTSIGWSAFSDCDALTTITIPDSVTSVGWSAFFDCSALTSITLPNSVTNIGEWVFFNCSALTSITIQNPECEIYDSENTISSTATIYGHADSTAQAYAEKYDRTFVALEDEIIASGECGAEGDNLTWTLDSTGLLTISGEGDMTNGSPWRDYKLDITTVVIEDGVTGIGDSMCCFCSNLTSVTIPDTVTRIGSNAFQDCSKLTSITIPESVKSIESNAFSNCTSLSSIMIPESVTNIETRVFMGCTSLTSISVSENNEFYQEIDGVLFNKNGDTILAFPNGKADTYAIPEHVTSIEIGAFMRCIDLISITIPDSVTNIGDAAFFECTNLTTVTISNSIKSIGEWTFGDCSSLTTINIPDSVTSIGWSAFSNCSALTSITIQNPECEIYDGADTIPSTATIHGYAGSTAQAYAEKYDRTFIALEEEPVITDEFYLNLNVLGSHAYETVAKIESIDNSNNTVAIVVVSEDKMHLSITGVQKGYTEITVKLTNGDVYKVYVTVGGGEQPITTEPTTTTTEATTTTTTTTEATTTTTTTESTTTTTTTLSSFKWSKDNWSFTETTSTKTNGELIGEEYLAKLKEDLTNVEYERLFGKDGYFSKPAIDRSYGMSAVMLLAKHGMLPFGEYKDGAENLYALENNEEVQSLITYYDALRYKDNYMQNLVDTNNRKNKDNVQKIKEMMGKYGMILLSYTTNSGVPHTVLVYTMATKGGYTSGGKNYDIKLSVCDPTKYDVDYIYFTEQGGCSVDKVSVCFIDGDPGLLNDGGCLAGSQTAAEGNYAFIECEKLNNQNNDIELDGEKKTMNNVPCFFAPNANPDGEIFQTGEGELDVMIRYSDWLLRASTKDHATVRFNKNDRVVSVTANEAAPYTLRMTLGDNCPMMWFTLHVSGASAKKAALTAVENGYILESDENLSGITAEAFGRDSAADISFSCEYKKVLIYQTEENTLGVKADADDDGVFETEVPAARKLLGDVNEDGSIDSVDAAEILVAAAAKGAGGEGLSEAQAAIADVDSSGDYDATDAAFILQYAAYAGSGGTASLPDFIGSMN